ncbi:efflux RND transporter periplasmic adaptor subunit [Brevibacillus ginsengisoli]|uniref:efflux RND transporter periplasmic adaptor subunit n=1 Tax=Brevibacillus ginsengisoli TaxID=363854 RepID=UPI003CE79131
MAEVVKNNPFLSLKEKGKKKLVLSLLAVAIVGGAGTYVYQTWAAQPSATSAIRLVSVKRGDVTESISAAGTVQASKRISLSPSDNSAIITAINVKVGDKVKAGQVLATLDTSSAQIQLKSAEASLLAAKAKLAEATKTKTTEELSALQANVSQTKSQLDSAKNGYELKKAQNDLAKAKANWQETQNTYNRQKNLYDTGVISRTELDQAKQSMDQAKIEYDNSIIQNNQSKGQSNSSLEQAQAAYANAVSALQNAIKGPDDITVQAAQASVAQAEAQLQEQQKNLNSLTVKAPMDGVVVELNGNLGEAPTKPFIVMDNSNSGNLEVLAQVSETDIGKVKEGLSATYTSNSYPDKKFTGKVTLVYPEATTDSGVTTYKVLLSVDNKENLLKTGMSVNANMEVGTHINVLYIPAAALKTRNGKDGVNIATGQSADSGAKGNSAFHFQPVTTGLFGSNMVEITSGLQEGDQVVLTLANPTSSGSNGNRQNQMGGFPGMGGFGGAGGYGGSGTGNRGGGGSGGNGGGQRGNH